MTYDPKTTDRLQTINDLGVLNMTKNETLDRITRLVSNLINVPIAAVTIVDKERQWFKSEFGLGMNNTPRELSFCAYAMNGIGPMVVRDATLDPRFRSNPLVTGHPGMRFYAGFPLCSIDGTPLGALCAIDSRPRDIRADELAVLEDLAELTMAHLERCRSQRDGFFEGRQRDWLW